MISRSINGTGIPERQDVFSVDGGDGRLMSHLAVRAPEDPTKTPPVLSFKRKREVEIPWSDVFTGITDDNPVSVSALRRYFEDAWGLGDLEEALADDRDVLFKDGNQFVRQIGGTDANPLIIFQTAFDDKGGPSGEAVTSGFVLKHGDSGRLYRIVETGPGLTAEDFKDWSTYDQSVWDERIQGVELVFETAEEAAQFFTDFDEIDLRPVVIYRKFEEMELARDFATQVKGEVDKVTQQLITNIVATTLNADEIENLQRRVLRLQISENDAKRAIRRLVSQAASLGFVLLPEGGTVPDPKADNPNATRDVPRGLYKEYTRTARWVTSHTRTETYRSGWWIFSKNNKRQVSFKRNHERQVLAYQEVDTDKDLLSERRQALAADGMEAIVFDRSPDGFITADGTPLKRIMARCDADEAFRRRCVVILPVYEESLLGERIVAKYSVFKRPLPGILSTILPRLVLDESLSYRIAWQAMELGELVSSINLAPGEQRQVTMTKTFEQETTVSRSASSIFDISQSDSSDLATEMENQTRQESQQSSNLNFSTKASASYGVFSGEATASGGTTHSLSEVSQAISKVAQKAARSVSQQNREEVSTSSTARVKITNTDQTEASLTNINQGRSLNLMFYRLYNRFAGGLFLDGLGFSIIPGVELIAGSGVHDSQSYSLSELARMIRDFQGQELPFDLRADQGRVYGQRILDSIQALLMQEYVPQGEADVEAPHPASKPQSAAPSDISSDIPVPAASVGLLHMRPPSAALDPKPKSRRSANAAAQASDIRARVDAFAKELNEATIESHRAMVPEDLMVTAPGLYLDAVVGVQPGTEPYSEEMRAQEVRMRAADVFARESEALYQRAQARHLANLPRIHEGHWITGLLPSQDSKSLTMSLSEPLPEGRWQIRFDGAEKAKLNGAVAARKQEFQHRWDDEQTWLKAADVIARIELFEEETGARIVSPL